MRKVVVHKPGSHDQLRLESFPDPEPGPGEVRVHASGAGINYADCVVRMGLYSSAKKYVGWPITPGFEYAGVIDRVGPGVTLHKEGDEVFGVTRFGGYSSHVVVPAHQVFARPPELTVQQAATFSGVYLTAWLGLYELANVRAGHTVLIHSAAGGVGTAALRLAKARGATTVGVVGRSHKVATAREFGADHVIDKSTEDLWQSADRYAPEGYSMILDPNGVATLKQSYEHLEPTGRLIIYGFHTMMPKKGGRPNWLKVAADWLRTPRFNPFQMTDQNRSVLAFNLSYLFDRHDILRDAMAELLGLLDSGKIKPLAVTAFPIEQVAEAQQAIESAQTVGKLVLTFA